MIFMYRQVVLLRIVRTYADFSKMIWFLVLTLLLLKTVKAKLKHQLSFWVELLFPKRFELFVPLKASMIWLKISSFLRPMVSSELNLHKPWNS